MIDVDLQQLVQALDARSAPGPWKRQQTLLVVRHGSKVTGRGHVLLWPAWRRSDSLAAPRAAGTRSWTAGEFLARVLATLLARTAHPARNRLFPGAGSVAAGLHLLVSQPWN